MSRLPDLSDLGAYLREQRESAQLSLRQAAKAAGISNPYLSQIERGLHEPSVRVLRAIAHALNMSVDALMAQAGLVDPPPKEDVPSVEEAIAADPHLTDEQRAALLAVYRSYVEDAKRKR